jgi:hypothetical protein
VGSFCWSVGKVGFFRVGDAVGESLLRINARCSDIVVCIFSSRSFSWSCILLSCLSRVSWIMLVVYCCCV